MRIDRSAPLTLAFVLVLMMNVGCSRSDTRAKSQREKLSATGTDGPQPSTQFPPCPVGNHEVSGATSSGKSSRKVRLTWKASTSEHDPRFGEIRYCIYRANNRPVLKGGAAPCTNCQLVTPEPVAGTEYVDKNVEDNAHYCYVAISVPAKTSSQSGFSNQAGAIISLGAPPPSCDPQKKGSSKESRRGR